MSVRMAVVGAGLIGCRHAEAVVACKGVQLISVVDPSEAGKTVALQHAVPCYQSVSELLEQTDKPDGVILATPNQLHVEQALELIDAGISVLVEKPLATDLAGARAIVEAGERAGIPVLTGHHRRHNPLVEKAKAIITSGELGRLTSAQATTWFYKPDEYFDVEWRRKPGAGPVYINLIHDMDMLRHLLGEVERVQAMESNSARGNEVEDTAVILLQFVSGALATMNVSDTIVAPWSWELTARENPAYPATPEACYLIGGTHGSLSLPNLALWNHQEQRSWWKPISATHPCFDFEDPLLRQVRQFAAVVQGLEVPLVSAKEGFLNQQLIEAVKLSSATGNSVTVSEVT